MNFENGNGNCSAYSQEKERKEAFPTFENRNRNEKLHSQFLGTGMKNSTGIIRNGNEVKNYHRTGIPAHPWSCYPGLPSLIKVKGIFAPEITLVSPETSAKHGIVLNPTLIRSVQDQSRCFFSVTILFNFYFLTSPLFIDRA